jgi:hypothetical protein
MSLVLNYKTWVRVADAMHVSARGICYLLVFPPLKCQQLQFSDVIS